MLWKVRTQDEEARCKRRDQKKWGTEPWTVSLALERLRFQIGEFKHITFSEAQPLTFYVVPWPVLTTPLNLTMDEIQWDSVDAFFQALQGYLVSK
ncbi:hypothetical protein B0H10DRAFT_1795317 [Mycena sp. CBHHK59/15]|nr:hypothetical protein B0H10DRAFT_1795317 [Mycena sp. CBHHK59/15]